jgi:hypothetical protein
MSDTTSSTNVTSKRNQSRRARKAKAKRALEPDLPKYRDLGHDIIRKADRAVGTLESFHYFWESAYTATSAYVDLGDVNTVHAALKRMGTVYSTSRVFMITSVGSPILDHLYTLPSKTNMRDWLEYLNEVCTHEFAGDTIITKRVLTVATAYWRRGVSSLGCIEALSVTSRLSRRYGLTCAGLPIGDYGLPMLLESPKWIWAREGALERVERYMASRHNVPQLLDPNLRESDYEHKVYYEDLEPQFYPAHGHIVSEDDFVLFLSAQLAYVFARDCTAQDIARRNIVTFTRSIKCRKLIELFHSVSSRVQNGEKAQVIGTSMFECFGPVHLAQSWIPAIKEGFMVHSSGFIRRELQMHEFPGAVGEIPL